MPKTKNGKTSREFSHHDVLSIVKDASVSQIQKVIGLLGEVKEARLRLENIFTGGASQAEVHSQPKGSSKGRGKQVRKTKKGKTLPEARPGSLRDIVHSILKEKGPVKSGAIVMVVKAQLGKKAGASLATQVSQVLSNKRDTKIKKVDRGVYAYQG